jgi:valyl-tRNA synthetase
VAEWAKLAGLENSTASEEINWLIDLISGIRSVRAEMNVPAGAKIPLQIVGADDATQSKVDTHSAAISRLARIETIDLSETVPEGAAQIILGEATFALPLGDVIDLGAEKARLSKDIAKLEDEIGKVEKKLSNEQFISKAPQSVIDDQRKRRDEAADRKNRIAAALARLS